jgi:hypothetical protein
LPRTRLGHLAEVCQLALRCFIDRYDAQPWLAALAVPLGLVDIYAVQPRVGLLTAIKAIDRTPGAQERLLCHLFGIVTALAQPNHDGVEALGVDHHELLERDAIAALGAPRAPTALAVAFAVLMTVPCHL